MWFPKFPYTNFSQINLDWVLRQIKELTEWMNRYFKDIRQDLDDEINNRIEGDKALGERIDKEIQDRTEADNALGQRIDTETTERKAADQQLQDNIDAEEAAREAADQQLQNNIDTLRSDAILKDGSTTTTAAIPFAQGIQTGSIAELSLDAGVSIEAQLDMNSHKITALADGSDDADAVNVGQMNTADNQAVMDAVSRANSYTDSQLEAFAADVHSIPAGGNSGQVLAKVDGTNYNVTWVDQQGGGGSGNVPAGGTTGQVLAKSTDADYQTEWVNQPEGLPAGGTEGQVVTKTADGAEWANAPSGLPAGGTTGQVVTKTDDGAEWANAPSGLPAGGTTGQVVTKTDDGAEWQSIVTTVWEGEILKVNKIGSLIQIVVKKGTTYHYEVSENAEGDNVPFKYSGTTQEVIETIPKEYAPDKENIIKNPIRIDMFTTGIEIETVTAEPTGPIYLFAASYQKGNVDPSVILRENTIIIQYYKNS